VANPFPIHQDISIGIATTAPQLPSLRWQAYASLSAKGISRMSTPPQWIVNLANNVTACLEPLEPMPPLGCHYHLCERCWEISIFPAHTEIIGGPQDGHQTAPRFRVDLLAIATLFSTIEGIVWQTRSVNEGDQLGAHIAVTGVCDEESVSVRVLQSAPSGFEPGRKAMTNEGCLIETW
jgi:hypothetical protein